MVWKLPVYSSLHNILTNPAYAGAYAYGRTRTETAIVDGQPRRRRGIPVAQDEWAVLIPEHHEGYIGWEQYQANRKRIAENVHMKGSMRRGAPRKGRSLLAGLLRCRRCGRRLHVTYSGAKGRVARYSCRGAAIHHGAATCISFGGLAADRAVEEAVLAVIQPGALEAAIRAAEHAKEDRKRDHEVVALKLEQARHEAERTRWQYDAAEPENRLVAAELERRWNRALEVVAEVEREWVAFEAGDRRKDERINRAELLQVAEDLRATRWEDQPEDSFSHYYLKSRKANFKILETPVGACMGTYRDGPPGMDYWRIAEFLMPFYGISPTGGGFQGKGRPSSLTAAVPMDDEHTLYVHFIAKRALDHYELLPNTSDWYGRFRPAEQPENDFMLDRDVQRNSKLNSGGRSYTGIPSGRHQDRAMTSSMGTIYDRSHEHLGTSDSQIIRTRRRLIRAAIDFAETGAPPAGVLNPEFYQVRTGEVFLPKGADWVEETKELRKAFVEHAV